MVSTLRRRHVQPAGSLRQTAKNGHASRISKGWPSFAVGIKSKGLQRLGNACYRREVTKTLLNVPRVLNWVMSHNSGIEYRCSRGGNHRVCPACAFKRVIKQYWDKNALQLNARVQELDRILFLQALPNPWTGSIMDQEDASQFQDHFITALNDSSNTQQWREEKDALFNIDIVYEDTCINCGTQTLRPDPPEHGISISILTHGSDSLQDAIQRYFSRNPLDKWCANCANTNHTSIARIEAGPQVLKIQLLIYDNFGMKLPTIVALKKLLNLSPYQTNRQFPLQYRLQTVISHEGRSYNGGHYTGQVKGPQGVFKTNDHEVIKSTERDMVSWPQMWEKRPFTPYILTFVMV